MFKINTLRISLLKGKADFEKKRSLKRKTDLEISFNSIKSSTHLMIVVTAFYILHSF